MSATVGNGLGDRSRATAQSEVRWLQPIPTTLPVAAAAVRL